MVTGYIAGGAAGHTHTHTRALVKMHACRGRGTRVYVHVGLAICNAL